MKKICLTTGLSFIISCFVLLMLIFLLLQCDYFFLSGYFAFLLCDTKILDMYLPKLVIYLLANIILFENTKFT